MNHRLRLVKAVLSIYIFDIGIGVRVILKY